MNYFINLNNLFKGFLLILGMCFVYTEKSYGDGVVSGGGGRGIFCDQQNHPQHGRLLDLYEGEVIFGWPQASRTMTRDEAFNFLAKRAVEAGHNPHSKDSVKDEEEQSKKALEWWINNKFKFINEGDRLKDVNDSYEPIIPKGCNIKQIANFYENKIILVDPTLWNQMSPLDQVALVYHEVLYAGYRIERGHTDSTYSRYVVGKILSLAPLNGLTEIISKTPVYYHCVSEPTDLPNHNYELFLYPSCQNTNCPVEAKFVDLDGKSMPSLDSIDVGGVSFEDFWKGHFRSSSPQEIDGANVWMRFESGEKPLTLKISTSNNGDFINASVGNVNCTKHTH